MNIETVAENLRNTIAGKEMLLAQIKEDLPNITDHTTHHVSFVTSEFLQVNIDELKRTLADVEKCLAKEVEQSWRDNPDRMGGQFTQDEIDNANRW